MLNNNGRKVNKKTSTTNYSVTASPPYGGLYYANQQSVIFFLRHIFGLR